MRAANALAALFLFAINIHDGTGRDSRNHQQNDHIFHSILLLGRSQRLGVLLGVPEDNSGEAHNSDQTGNGGNNSGNNGGNNSGSNEEESGDWTPPAL